jgi:hypothetical protein
MERPGHDKAKILASIFDAVEEVKLTEQNLEIELNQAGINSKILVEDVLKLVTKLSNIGSTLDYPRLPMAASKKDDQAKNDMIEFLKKGKKLKD